MCAAGKFTQTFLGLPDKLLVKFGDQKLHLDNYCSKHIDSNLIVFYGIESKITIDHRIFHTCAKKKKLNQRPLCCQGAFCLLSILCELNADPLES